MNRVRVPQCRPPFAELEGSLEECLLLLGSGNLSRCVVDAGNPLALFAVMVGEENPLDFFDPDLLQMVEDRSVSEVEEDRRFTVAENVNIASVLVDKDVRPIGCRGLDCGGICCGHARQRWNEQG